MSDKDEINNVQDLFDIALSEVFEQLCHNHGVYGAPKTTKLLSQMVYGQAPYNFVKLIKEYRGETGASLRDARVAVEKLLSMKYDTDNDVREHLRTYHDSSW